MGIVPERIYREHLPNIVVVTVPIKSYMRQVLVCQEDCQAGISHATRLLQFQSIDSEIQSLS